MGDLTGRKRRRFLRLKDTPTAASNVQIMAQLYGRTYTKDELVRRTGDIGQIARVRPCVLADGPEDGVKALHVTTGSGLEFTVLASRGLDISSASFNGRPLAWRSSTADTHPGYFDHEGEGGRGWLRSFYGGLVVTCGLSYAGANGTENGRLYGLHGRVGNLPASCVSWRGWWEGDEYRLAIEGRVRETTVFGENLELHRTIATSLGSKSVEIRDEVHNLSFRPAEHMMLYHVNLGFPVVSEDSRLLTPALSISPRDAEAQAEADRALMMDPPRHGYREKVYFHELPEDADEVCAALLNPTVSSGAGKGLGLACLFSARQLPRLTEWKMMDEGTYVLGIEPANCSVLGRAAERQAGTLDVIPPLGKRDYRLELRVLAGEQEMEASAALVRPGRSG